jgi:hypothetical protein
MTKLESPAPLARKARKRIYAYLGWLAAALALLVPPMAIQTTNNHHIERIDTRYRISLERFHELMVEKKEIRK